MRFGSGVSFVSPHNGGAHSAPARERSGLPPLVDEPKRQAPARSRRSAPEFVRAMAEAWGPRERPPSLFELRRDLAEALAEAGPSPD